MTNHDDIIKAALTNKYKIKLKDFEFKPHSSEITYEEMEKYFEAQMDAMEVILANDFYVDKTVSKVDVKTKQGAVLTIMKDVNHINW